MTFIAEDGTGANQNVKTLAIGSELVQVVLPALGTTATISHTAQGTTDATILAANTSRLSARIYNDTTAGNLKVALGSAVTSTNFTIVLAPGSFIQFSDYTGAIHALWDATGSGQVLVTEVTP